MLGMAIRGRAQADRLACRLEIISPLPQNVTNSRTEVELSFSDTTHPSHSPHLDPPSSHHLPHDLALSKVECYLLLSFEDAIHARAKARRCRSARLFCSEDPTPVLGGAAAFGILSPAAKCAGNGGSVR